MTAIASSWRWALALATLVVAALAVAPLLAVDHIPANDYPFHLARIAILAQNSPAGLLGSHYTFGSWLLPNMALDALALPLTQWLQPTTAVKLFLVLMQLAFVAGCVALHRAAFGRASAWPLLGGLLLYNGIFLWGFYPYLFTAAVALLAAAAWRRAADGWPRQLAVFAAALVLMWGHMGGFAVFAVVVGSMQLFMRLQARPRHGPKLALRLALDVLPFIAAVALFLLVSPGSERAGEGGAYGWWGAKPYAALFAVQSGVLWADVLVLAGLGALVLALALTRRLVVDGALAAAAGMLWLAFVVLPPELLGSQFADVRLVPLAAMLSLLAVAPRRASTAATIPAARPQAEALVLAVALGLGAAKTGALVTAWRAHAPQTDRVVQALRQLPAGSTLFAATAAPYTGMLLTRPGIRESWHPPLKHVASYASVYGPVFVPMTFADPHKQPMVVLPAYRPVKALQGDSPFKVPQAVDLVDVSQRLNAHLRQGGGPPLGRLFLLVVGPERYGKLPVLDGWAVHAAGDGFVIFQTTPAAHATADKPDGR